MAEQEPQSGKDSEYNTEIYPLLHTTDFEVTTEDDEPGSETEGSADATSQ
ncbi:hypothetical protein [Streptomyces sp. NPDC029003]